MKYFINCVLLAMLSFYSFLIEAKEFPDYPTITILHNENGDRNSIQISCSPIDNKLSIKCQFYQMSVSYEEEPEGLDKKIENEILRVTKSKDFLKKDPIKEVKSLCLKEKKEYGEVIQHFNKMKKGEKKKYMKNVIETLDKACMVNTVKKAKEIISEMTRLDMQWKSKTCKVWPNTWEEIFNYKYTVDNLYWVTNAEPTGDCGIINVSTLKKDGDYFWKYESRRVVTNKEGKALLLSCKELEERSVIYSWKPKQHEVNCQEIKFGL